MVPPINHRTLGMAVTPDGLAPMPAVPAPDKMDADACSSTLRQLLQPDRPLPRFHTASLSIAHRMATGHPSDATAADRPPTAHRTLPTRPHPTTAARRRERCATRRGR
jgi:hypothetical protein